MQFALSRGLLQQLTKLVTEDSSDDVLCAVASVLDKMSAHEHMHPELITNGVVNMLVALLKVLRVISISWSCT